MKFYTNVQLIGNQVLVREVDNGVRKEYRDEFFPTLFVKSKKKTKFKTLNGDPVDPSNPAQFVSAVSSIKSMRVLMDSLYMEMIDISISTFLRSILKMKSSLISVKIKLVTLDIEVSSDTGIP